MKRATTSYRDGLLKSLAKPEEAAAYLNAALEDGDQDAFLMALRDIADARGMESILQSAGLRLAVEVR